MITISIPSKGRPAMLTDCVRSIQESNCQSYEIFIHVTSMNDVDEYSRECFFNDPRVCLRIVPSATVIQCQNWTAQKVRDFYLPISDDVLFSRDALNDAFYNLTKKFHDFDGVVGLNQKNVPGGKDTAFMLIGRKFLERFPDRCPFYPGYYQFGADSELGEFAKSINKFAFCEEAIVEHLHPATGRPCDDTHIWARKHLGHDHALRKHRSQRADCWGNKFL